MSDWIDRGSYFEHNAPQGSQKWLDARIGRVTGSESGALAGLSNFKTAEKTGKTICGLEENNLNIDIMAHGTKTEPIARRWYEKTFKCKVIERGLCVPKSDYRIGASVDGEIEGEDGILEIKCPQKMYKPLQIYNENVKSGWKVPINYHDHIFPSHYCQMLQGMHVLNKKFCDYVVYCTSTGEVFTQRIPFNKVYWDHHYSILKRNYSLYVSPHLKLKKMAYPIWPY